MDPLITLTELKDALDVSGNDDDDRYNQALDFASEAVRDYCDRSFDVAGVTETRTYRWDPRTGFLSIDEATDITAVRINGSTVDEAAWLALPYRPPWPYYMLELPPYSSGSPEMGFTRSLDKIWQTYVAQFQTVEVDGTWGWPEVPKAVKQATIWTAALFADNPTPYVSESIEGYSYLRQNPLKEAIPDRAKGLLAPYVRPLL